MRFQFFECTYFYEFIVFSILCLVIHFIIQFKVRHFLDSILFGSFSYFSSFSSFSFFSIFTFFFSLSLMSQMNYRKHQPIGCAFCRNCSKLHPKDFRFNQWPFHAIKDNRGNLLCPMLKGLKCTGCGEPGHTPRYCTNKPAFTLGRYLAQQNENSKVDENTIHPEHGVAAETINEDRLQAEFAEADDLLWQYVDAILLYCLDAPPQYAEWAWNKGELLDWKTQPHHENFARNVY